MPFCPKCWGANSLAIHLTESYKWAEWAGDAFNATRPIGNSMSRSGPENSA